MTAFCAAVIVVFSSFPVYADEETAAERREYTYRAENGTVQEAMRSLAEHLPDGLREEYGALGTDTEEGTAEILRQKLDARIWAEKFVQSVTTAAAGWIPDFLPVLSLVLLMAAAQAVLPDTEALKKTYLTYAGLFISLEIFRLTDAVVEHVRVYLTDLCGMMNFFIPVVEAVCLFGGHITGKAVTSGGLLLLVTLIGNFNNLLLVPMTVLLFSLSCVTMTCPEVKLGGLVSGVRKWMQRLWGWMTMLFSFLLGMQTILAGAADSLAARTAKFAIGSFVPVAGGMLSEAFSTVREGMHFIRQTAGIGGICLILSLLLPGIVPLVMSRLLLSVTASAADMLGVSTAAGLLHEIGGILEFLLGIVLAAGLLFLIAILLFMKTQTGA